MSRRLLDQNLIRLRPRDYTIYVSMPIKDIPLLLVDDPAIEKGEDSLADVS